MIIEVKCTQNIIFVSVQNLNTGSDKAHRISKTWTVSLIKASHFKIIPIHSVLRLWLILSSCYDSKALCLLLPVNAFFNQLQFKQNPFTIQIFSLN